MKIGLALRELHRSENDLAHELLVLGERHRSDHDIHHLSGDLARWSQRHVTVVAEAARAFGESLDPDPQDDVGLAARLRERGSELVGRRGAPALVLLRDLREVYVKASGVSVDWELIAQAAQGSRNRGLLDLAERCHPDTLRQARWANSMLKETASQVLLS
jgi:hypothetical protein